MVDGEYAQTVVIPFLLELGKALHTCGGIEEGRREVREGGLKLRRGMMRWKGEGRLINNSCSTCTRA